MRIAPIAGLVSALLLSLPATSEADGFCRGRSFVHRAPVYHAPYVAPAKVFLEKEYVPVKVAVVPDYYYGFSPELQLQLLTDAVAARMFQMQQQAQPIQQQPPAQGQAAPVVPNGAPAQMPPAAPEANAVGDKLQAIVGAKCIGCHGGQPNRMNLTDMAKLDSLSKALVFTKVHNGKMPKNQPPLSDEEVSLFAQWAD